MGNLFSFERVGGKMNCRGEMTSKMIISLILVIFGFVVLVFFYSGLQNTLDTDREVCHQSVVLRGSLPDIAVVGSKDLLPLECKTSKICLTSKLFGKGECEGAYGEEFSTLRISNDLSKQENEVKEVLAEELADCWAMMGEGKIQLFPRDIFSGKNCVICSRISFDKNIVTKDLDNFQNYLNNNVPGRDYSYWDFLTDYKLKDGSLQFDKGVNLDSSEKAIVFSEYTTSKAASLTAAITGGIAGSAGVAVAGAKLGAVAGPTGIVAGFVIGAGAGVFLNDGIEDSFGGQDYLSSIELIDYNAKDIGSLGCDTIESIS